MTTQVQGLDSRGVVDDRNCHFFFLAYLALSIAVASVLRFPIADIPLERDEGEYAYIAQRWLQGEIPYKESFDQKPPGVLVIYAVIERWLGGSPAAIHWGMQIYSMGTLLLVLLLGRRLCRAPAGGATAIFCAVLVADKGVLGNAANTEVFMILPLTGLLLATLVCVEQDALHVSLIAGLLGSIALLFKQVALPNVVFSLLLVFWLSRRPWQLSAAFLAGLAAGLLGTLAYFWQVDALGEMLDCVITVNLQYASSIGWARYPANFWHSFRGILETAWPIYLLAGAGLLAHLGAAKTDAERAPAVVPLWLAFSMLGVATGGYFREHYFIQCIPPVALLASRGVSTAARITSRGGLRTILMATIIAGAGGYAVVMSPDYYWRGTAAEKARAVYGTNPFPESLEVAQFIAGRSAPDDTIFVFGAEPQIYYYAHRRCASRYIFLNPLFLDKPNAELRRRQLFGDLEKNPPKCVVLLYEPSSFITDEESDVVLYSQLLNDLRRFMDRSYLPVAWMPFVTAAPIPLETDTTTLLRPDGRRPFLVVLQRP